MSRTNNSYIFTYLARTQTDALTSTPYQGLSHIPLYHLANSTCQKAGWCIAFFVVNSSNHETIRKLYRAGCLQLESMEEKRALVDAFIRTIGANASGHCDPEVMRKNLTTHPTLNCLLKQYELDQSNPVTYRRNAHCFLTPTKAPRHSSISDDIDRLSDPTKGSTPKTTHDAIKPYS